VKKLAKFSINQSLFVNLLTVFILVTGIMCAFEINKEAFPRVSYDVVQILTLYSGSHPSNVERYITSPLEKEIRSVDGVKEYSSSSSADMSIVIASLDPNVDDKQRVVRDIEKAVDRFTDLPERAEEPQVEEFTSRHSMPLIEIAVSGDMEEMALQDYVLALEDRLLDISGVSSVSRRGWRKREVRVRVSPEALQEEHLSIFEIMEALDQENINVPGGVAMAENTREILVETDGEFDEARVLEQIGKTVIRSNDRGGILRIRDVAKVQQVLEKASTLVHTDGKPSINLILIPRENADIIETTDEAIEVSNGFQEENAEQIQLAYVNDASYFVRRRLGILTRNGIAGIGLVLITLLIFLSPRTAFMCALGIPISFLGAIVMMYFIGFSINLISMFGLIMVLGMIVDDAIVVSENVYRHYEKGMPPREAAILGAAEVGRPVTATILTTIAAFLPLAFMQGILGKFIWQIPVTVTIALIVSLAEVLFVLPAHLADILRLGHKKTKKRSPSRWFSVVQEIYLKFLKVALKLRYLVILLLLVMLAGAIYMVQSKRVKFELFPSAMIEMLRIRAEVPVGTPLEITEKLMEPVEAIVAGLSEEELDHYMCEYGIVQDEAADPFTERGSHLAHLIVYLTPENKRERDHYAITETLEKQLQDVQGFTKIGFENVRTGPPVGRPVNIRIRGDDFAVLESLAGSVKQVLQTIPGVKDIRDNHQEGRKTRKIVVDSQAAARAGLSTQQIGLAIRFAVDGGLATEIRSISAEEPIEVIVSFSADHKVSIEDIFDITIPNARGRLIPLSQVAAISEETPSPQSITHWNGKRTISVMANLDEKVITSEQANHQASQQLENLTQDHLGYGLEFSGEFEDNKEALENLMRAFIVASIMIYCMLAGTFHSLLHPIMVMIAIPFGVIGVVATFYLHGLPLSFFTLLGIVGLSGVVVNDAIVLVDFINRLRRSGVDLRNAVIEAGRTRLRPVILTTISTIAGLSPVAYGIGGRDPFLMPMALAICWGLLFATVLTLVAIPCLYLMTDDLSKIILRKKNHRLDQDQNQDQDPPEGDSGLLLIYPKSDKDE